MAAFFMGLWFCWAGTAAGADMEKVVPQSLADLEQKIRDVLEEGKVPGIGIALVDRERVLWSAGLGKADVASGREATAETLFRIGSVSKAFVGLSVLVLQEEGKLDLADTYRSRAPEIAFENPWESTDPVRLVHLLEHTAGFNDISLREYAHNEAEPIALRDALAVDPSTRRSRWRPGTRMSYCNSGPPMVAYVVEKVTGRRFEDFVQERFFEPMGMTTATYFHPTGDAAGRMATLYRSDGVTPEKYWHVSLRPSGSINASAAEMARFVQLFLNRGSVAGRALVQPASLERMERPGSTYLAREGGVGYGLGNYASVTGGWLWHGHDGGINGGLAQMAYSLDAGVGYVFFINSGNGEAFTSIGRLVRNYLTRDRTAPVPAAAVPLAPEIEVELPGWYEPVTPRQELFRFLERIAGLHQLKRTASGYELSPLLGKSREYVPLGGRLLRRADSPVATAALVDAGEDGRLLQTGTMTFRKLPAPFAWLRAGTAAACLLLLSSSLLFALAWGPRKLLGRMKGVRHLRARALPLVSALCLVAAVVVFAVAAAVDVFGRLGHLTPWSLGVCLLSCAFAATAAGSVWVAWRAPAAEVNRWALWHSRAVALASVVVAIYLLAYGVIGLRTWA